MNRVEPVNMFRLDNNHECQTRHWSSSSNKVLCFFLITISLVPINTTEDFIKGKSIPCTNEGKEVFITMISDNPCITCKCQNHVVACEQRRCSLSNSCYFAIRGKKSACCDVCKECEWRGTWRQHDEQWSDPADSCTIYNCKSGVLTSTKVECHVKCSNPLPPSPGECCPRCPSPTCQAYAATLGNQESPRTHLIPAAEKETTDPCVQCQCVNGFSFCWRQACPVLPCPAIKIFHLPGDCCPQCQRGAKRISEIPGQCLLGKQELKTTERLAYDACTNCACNGTTVSCRRESCPSLECPAELQVQKDDECCPRCRGREEQQQVCSYRGKVYQDGETWRQKNCTKCTCRGTKVSCEYEDCSRLPPCPPGLQEKVLPGECCRTCVEADGVCTAFGDSGYKTFDGRIYDFKASPCRYLLTKDGSGNNFSISVVNDVKHGTTKSRSVILKVENTKVQMGQNLKVKVGGKRVRLPHVILSVLSIRLENNSVVVRTTNFGIKLVWDDENYLEIHMPTVFKQKLCGLCGNYNNNPKDDLLNKRGQVTTSVAAFAQSWMSGKKAACKGNTLTTKDPTECDRRWDVRHRAISECNHLTDPPLVGCHSNVYPGPYFNPCITEHCECKSRPKKCHCQVLKAYVRECERLGVTLPNWKKATDCEGTHCPPGSVYNPCGASCRKTCKNYQQSGKNANCHRKCQPGCECTMGKVWHRHRCISPQYCPRT